METVQSHIADVGSAAEVESNEFLTFSIGDESYGIHISFVYEIIGLTDITRIPRLPRHIKGVMNLRGKVIPVIDLRIKFDADCLTDTEETCIIVVEVDEAPVGLIADRVCDVQNIPDRLIDKMPDLGSKVDTEFILGTGRVEDRYIMLIDIRAVLGLAGGA